MAEFEIKERTEPFTLDEVFSFIDDTNISKMDAHELKSRIADAVRGIREKVIDEFSEKLIYELKGNIFSDEEKFKYARKQQEQICHQNTTLKRAIKYVEIIAEQLKGEN